MAVIYVRQSLDKTGDGLGVARQEDACRSLCEARGWPVDLVIRDNDRSASKGAREGYAQLLAMIESKATDRVVVLRVDRLLRRMVDLESLIELTEQTGVAITTVEGELDLSSPSGRLMGRVMASFGRAEMEVKGARQKLANVQKAKAGKPHGSRRPYGYQYDLVTLDEDEAAVLSEMGRRVIAGHSFREVAWWANENSHFTTGGLEWNALAIRTSLTRHRYAGVRLYEGVEYPATWPAIFDAVTWQRLQYVIQSKRTGTPMNGLTATARKYLLTGIVTCGKCGMHLSGHMKRDQSRPGAPPQPKMPRYICRSWGDTKKAAGCGGIRRNALALDHFIREAVIFRLDSPELADLLRVQDGVQDGVQDDLAKLLESRGLQQQRKDQLVKDYATGLLTREELAQAKLEAQAALDQLDAQIAELGRSSHVSGIVSAGETVREAWTNNGNDWRRNLIQLLISDITVMPSLRKPQYWVDGALMRFDTSAIRITWRA